VAELGRGKWAAKRIWARRKRKGGREKKTFLLFSKELTKLNSNTNLNSNK
jgi:hypothetical protein